jgi:FMN reductase (NADPH)
MNSTLETQLNHRSIRAFKSSTFSEETLSTLIQVAQRTATSSGHQAASILRITDQSQKDAIAKICNQTYVATSAELWIFLVDQKRNHDLTLATGAESSNAGSFSRFLQGFTDAILMAQNVVVAAESLGIGTVYLGSIHNDIPQLNSLLNLPDYTFAALGLAMGYPDQDPELKPRMDMTLRVYENHYPDHNYTLDDFKAYDDHLATYYDLRNANTRVDSFSKQISKRYAGVSNRDDMLDEILKKGFK